VEINEKVGISADFVTILERGMGYRARRMGRKRICNNSKQRT
jgi:hypothetical protein